jgi:ABC-type Zn2+ transport system substrate-binding protein/surface adhesin
MKTIELNDSQIRFIIGAVEREGYSIFDDPSAYDFYEEDYESEEDFHKALSEFKDEVCTKVIEKLK